QAAGRRPDGRDRDGDLPGRLRAAVEAPPRSSREGALLVERGPLPLGRRFLQDARRPDLFLPGRGRDARDRERAAAPAGHSGEARAAAGAAQRPALHLQAAGRPPACRAAAGRGPQEGPRGVKIAAVESISLKVPFTFGGSPTGYGGRNWTTNN